MATTPFVAYNAASKTLSVVDNDGRRLEFLEIGKFNTSRENHLVSVGRDHNNPGLPMPQVTGKERTATTAPTPSVARVRFFGDSAVTGSTSLYLKSADGKNDLYINDVTHEQVFVENQLANAINASLSSLTNDKVTLAIDKVVVGGSGSTQYETYFTFTDLEGRSFERIEIRNQAQFESLISLAGDVKQGSLANSSTSATATTAVLGTLAVRSHPPMPMAIQ